MLNKLRFKILLLIIPLAFFFILEGVATYFESKSIQPHWKSFFCDDIHLTIRGHELFSNLLMNEIGPILGKDRANITPLRIAVFGGSVSAGNCSTSDVWSTTWVNFLQKKLGPNVVLKNYSLSGENSDYTVNKIEELVQRREYFDIAIITDLGNELDLTGDSRDRNYKKLKDIDSTYISLSERRISPLRNFAYLTHLTLVKNLSSYRLLSNFILSHRIIPTRFQPLFTMMNFLKETPEGIPLLLSKSHRKLSVENFRLNLLDIKSISKKAPFKILLMPLPTNEESVFIMSPELGNAFKELYSELRSFLSQFSKTESLSLIDLNTQFQELTKPD